MVNARSCVHSEGLTGLRADCSLVSTQSDNEASGIPTSRAACGLRRLYEGDGHPARDLPLEAVAQMRRVSVTLASDEYDMVRDHYVKVIDSLQGGGLRRRYAPSFSSSLHPLVSHDEQRRLEDSSQDREDE
jgi:hypothetical protein